MAALLGIQLMILLGALHWAGYVQLRGMAPVDVLIALLVALAVIVSDLVMAIALGALLSGLRRGWQRYPGVKP
jgi:MFS superfamily sulfate permease-like transporter